MELISSWGFERGAWVREVEGEEYKGGFEGLHRERLRSDEK